MNNELNAMIKDVITKARYEKDILWLSVDIQDNVDKGDYEKVAIFGAELTKKSKALNKLNEKLADNEVAAQLHTALVKRNGHMIDKVNVKFVKESYAYIIDFF